MLVPDKEYTRKSEYDFTGERFMPQQTDPLLALEHYHRYCFASRFAKNRRILDIACGEGYGSAFLAKWASEVIGIDSDRTTIDHAANKYSSMHNLTFKVGRCETGHEDLGSFDLVVSYETIEHLTENDQVALLNNIGSILKQDGIFIVSSPEKNEYAAAVQGKNQFHKHEMTLAELKSRLETHFKHVYLCGQRILSLSAIWQLERWQEAQFRFNAKTDLLEEVPRGESFSPPLYLIALCSNDPLSNDIIAEANSFYFDTANVEKTKYFYEWAMQLDADVQKSREAVQRLERQMEERASWAMDLQKQIKDRAEVIDSLKKELEERTAWALDLQHEIKSHTDLIDSQKKEIEERTRWAQSLETEVAEERACSKQLNEKLTETTDKLAETTDKLAAIASLPIYRLLKKIKLLPDAFG